MSNKKAFSKTNKLKVLAGTAFTDYINKELTNLVKTGIIKSAKSSQNFRHKGYAYEKQEQYNKKIKNYSRKITLSVLLVNTFRQMPHQTPLSHWQQSSIHRVSQFRLNGINRRQTNRFSSPQ